MRYEVKTINGYEFFECSSALQKSIRRGLEDDALFWAVELSKWKELAKKKDDKHYPERLFLVHAVVMLSRAKKSRYVDWQTCYAFGCHESRFRPIPDFALDKHTKSGRKLGRGMAHFIDEGCKLENFHPVPEEEVSKQLALKALSDNCNGLF
jgi:replication-associated recombination protein RarA